MASWNQQRFYSNIPSTSSQSNLASPPLPSPAQPSPLKPMFLADNHRSPEKGQFDSFEQNDLKLKKRIRALKVISRILSTLLSIAVFVPIAMTFQVYLSTRNTYKDVRQPDGSSVSRTAWAKDSVVWPTVMYFAVALVSLVLNAVILVAYLRSVGTANLAATVATGFNWIVIFGNMVVWGVAVVVYRVEKKDDDLWGWTCGSAAETLQDVFKTEVNFDKYCTVQGASWVAGILHVLTVMMSAAVYFLTIKRIKAKKEMKAHQRLVNQY